MTFVYLCQHAKSFYKEQDPSQKLTPEGEKDITSVANFLAGKNLKIDAIYHSGKTRAEQTASLLAKIITPLVQVTKKDGLQPLDDVVIIGDEIDKNIMSCLYVGHLPFMEKLVSFLITRQSDTKTVKFVNAGIVCLEKIGDNWLVRWVLTPDLVIDKTIYL